MSLVGLLCKQLKPKHTRSNTNTVSNCNSSSPNGLFFAAKHLSTGFVRTQKTGSAKKTLNNFWQCAVVQTWKKDEAPGIFFHSVARSITHTKVNFIPPRSCCFVSSGFLLISSPSSSSECRHRPPAPPSCLSCCECEAAGYNSRLFCLLLSLSLSLSFTHTHTHTHARTHSQNRNRGCRNRARAISTECICQAAASASRSRSCSHSTSRFAKEEIKKREKKFQVVFLLVKQKKL